MIKMTPLMKELLWNAMADGMVALVATVTPDGTPVISPKGSVAVFDDSTLSFWERSHRSTEKNLAHGGRVCVYYRNTARKDLPFGAGILRFYGTARIVTDPATKQKVWDNTIPIEQERDKDKSGVGVLIDVDRIEELSGKVIMDKNS
jgi:general stress protein 26